MTLHTLSVALQVIGLIVTAVGLRTTWREFHEPGERFRDPFVRALKRLDPRRRRDRTVTPDPARLTLTTNDASVRIGYGPLPADDRAAIDMLAERMQGLRGDFEMTTTGVRRDIGQVTRRVDGLEGRVTVEVDRLERVDRHVATDGLRLESIGLLIIAAATVLQAVGALLFG